ncbi:MAG TPA: hypothetical protein VG917_00195 [Patescibacteria group bacterium]|nr:hypothetical protein [Patescibacteria group bacterium]
MMIEELTRRETQRERLERIFYESAMDVGDEFFDGVEATNLLPLANALITKGAILKATTSQYDLDQELQANFPNRFDLPTPFPSIRITVTPYQIEQATELDIRKANNRGYNVQTEGPQVVVYIMDDFEEEQVNLTGIAANFVYVNAVVNAIVNKTRPWNLSWGDFRKETYDALVKVREFVAGLPESRRQHLPFAIRKLNGLNNSQLLMETEIILGHKSESYSNLTSSEQFFGHSD